MVFVPLTFQNFCSIIDAMKTPYDDIIDLPHHESKTRPKMSVHDRAAQFAPFAALNVHAGVIRKTTEDHVHDMDTEDTSIAFDGFFYEEDE